MGSLYPPTYRGPDGTLKESSIIWLKYRDALGVLCRAYAEGKVLGKVKGATEVAPS